MPFFDQKEETLAPVQIERRQREKLANMLRAVLPANRFIQRKLCGILDPADLRAVDSLSLADIPFTTRDEIERDQADNAPYGTNLSYPLGEYTRLHQTSGSLSGPLRWLDRNEDWQWWQKLWSAIYGAAGLTPKDRFLFPFSFGPFIGFWSAFETAVALGNLSLPAGGMSTKARLQYALANDATVICCTPTYALRMAEVAAQESINIHSSSIRALIVAGEPGGSIPETRRRIESAFNARVFDHAGMTEIGAFAFECLEAPGGLHINDAEFIAEIIDPQTGRALRDEQAGELVLTNLGRWGMPLIRYRTGDLARLTRGACPCGRSFARLDGGVLGRIDDRVIIRGNNVYPAAIEAILRRFDGIAEYCVEVDESAALTDLMIRIEPMPDAQEPAALCEAVANAVRDALHFRPTVSLAPTGSLPRFEMKSKRWTRVNR